jgi:hypothetical protein
MPSLQQLLRDNKRGATAIFQDALDLFLSLPDEKIAEETWKGAMALKDRFPVMGLFQYLSEETMGFYSAKEVRAIIKRIKAKMESNRIVLASKARHLIPEKSNIITISYSNLVAEVILGAHKGGRVSNVIALRSEPQREGEQLAIVLRKAGIPVTVIDDDQFSQGLEQANLVLTGSDLIGRDFFINKIGTAALVAGANQKNIPVWIVGDYLRYEQFAIPPKTCPFPFETIPYPRNAKLFLETGLLSPDRLPLILKES